MGTHAIHVVLLQKASNQGEEDDTTIKKTIQILMRRGLRIGVGRNSLETARRGLLYLTWHRRGCGWPPALEHRQLPLRTTLVKAQNVQIARRCL
jgi:hypothetical protein